MPITSADIKLMQPERLSDNDDGGGSMTGLPVIDGEINNLFEDISRINRTYGNTALRKAFLKVDTASADLYLDSHAIISAQPNDPNVSGLLFTTDNFYDERKDSQNRIESFVVAGPQTGLRLRGNQLEGQNSIICYSGSTQVATPVSGDTYMLQIGNDTNTQQFVKVLDVTETEETFTYVEGSNVKSFRVRQWVIQLTTALERDYPNVDPHPYTTQTSIVFSTSPSASAKYYGTSTLAEAITAGATSIKVTDTFAPIIPTASAETARIDQRPGGFVETFVAASTPLTVTIDARDSVVYFPTPILPGSINITYQGATFVDAYNRLQRPDGSTVGFEQTEINHAAGTITLTENSFKPSNLSVTYTPAAIRVLIPNTGKIEITDNNRNFNYVLQLDALPARKSFNLSYQYLNKWYNLQDDGAGNLFGDGSGQIAYDTGSVIATLQAQPDAGSKIFFYWTNADVYTNGEASAKNGALDSVITTTRKKLVPSSITINWTEGTAKSASDDGQGGLVGDATGTVNYADGRISLTGANPDAGTDWIITYDYTPTSEDTGENVSISENTNASDMTLNLAGGLKPGSIKFAITKVRPREVNALPKKIVDDPIVMNFIDNGFGGIVWTTNSSLVVGTIDYTTGAVNLSGTSVLLTTDIKIADPNADGFWETLFSSVNAIEVIRAQTITVTYTTSAAAAANASDTIPSENYDWTFYLSAGDSVLPRSVILNIGSILCFDDGNGQIIKSFNTSTGVGTAIGTIDYDTSLVTISNYSGRPANTTITPVSVIIGSDFNVLFGTTFRTTNSPLRPSGFTVRAKDVEGVPLTAVDDGAGNLTGAGITGTVDLDDGLIDIEFATPVDAQTLYYNSVSFKSIPLDKTILGLDPVRLPSDGRVPIFRDAEILVLTHTAKDLIDGPSDGLVIDAGRTVLHTAWIEDNNGTQLKADQYIVDKAAGTATLAASFSAIDANDVALEGNLFFVHRIDDMALCTEARIDGQLTLAQPIPHDYPVGSWVASAVYLGDLQARIKNLRSYITDVGYDGTGIETDAKYNNIAYPIAIDNGGSVPDRWMIKFNSSSAFSLYSEERGLVGTGSTAVDFSPTNPQTGTPYFTIKADGWGAGWQVGNCLFFNTNAAAAPLWMIRTVLPGKATEADDRITIEIRGDHN